MAVSSLVHENECGLPLNAIDWLETHHASKGVERSRMIRDLHLKPGSRVVDAGCGPGLWTPLLAREIGLRGKITGVDISQEALVTANQRSTGKWYRNQVCYTCATLEELPIEKGTSDAIFSANVSQYLPRPVDTFAAMRKYLTDGGRLIIKDIDFGTIHFHSVNEGLQTRVYEARKRWERERVEHGYAFEDSWVGSKLAGYLLQAGFKDIVQKQYTIKRWFPLPDNFRAYLQGIAEWFVCEGAPFLSSEDTTNWLQCFHHALYNALNQKTFAYEETEFVVSGVWHKPELRHIYIVDMPIHALQDVNIS